MSFHNKLKEWEQFSSYDGCPVCQQWPKPDGEVVIKEFPASWLIATPSISCLYGQCCIVSKIHAIELYELDEAELANYMKEVQISAKALKEVTKAIKINYEIHGNSIPHLHMHLYPRHQNDRFEGIPINAYKIEGSVYKGTEFYDFIDKMKTAINDECNKAFSGIETS
jgi:diadenosine tetraphosphate (Ap4A) HIT family hydrolase